MQFLTRVRYDNQSMRCLHSSQTASYFESLGMLGKAIDMWRIVDVYRAGDTSVLMQLVKLYHL